jgi:hypothetical protein
LPVLKPVPLPVLKPVPLPVLKPVPLPVLRPVPLPVLKPVPLPVLSPVPLPVLSPVPLATTALPALTLLFTILVEASKLAVDFADELPEISDFFSIAMVGSPEMFGDFVPAPYELALCMPNFPRRRDFPQ